jgi:hypothetical protein
VSHIRLGFGICDHPKLLAVSLGAVGMYVKGAMYSSQYLTDGAIVAPVVADWLTREGRPDIAEDLVAAGLWATTDTGVRMVPFGDPLPKRRPEGQPPKWLDFGVVQIVSRAYAEWRKVHGPVRPWREAISPTLRALVIERDGSVCQLCGKPARRRDIHLDHIKPLAHGGPTVAENLQVAHARCNMRKGARYEVRA